MEDRIIRLAPSILSADFCRLGEQIQKLEENDIDLLHIDIMDGVFVPSISFGMPVIRSIRKITDMFFDVHLMISEPIRYIEELARCGADGITVHIEACEDLVATLKKIKEQDMKCAVAINPDTDIEKIENVLHMVDMVLVMSVYPGFGGQKFILNSFDKVRKLDKVRKDKKLDFLIEIDGGVNVDNAKMISESGADWLVAGTAVFSGNIDDNIMKIKEEI